MWKEIKIAPYYLINELGQVKRKAYLKVDSLGRKTNVKEHILKQHKDKYGYLRVTLIIGLNKPKFIQVHRLVADSFLENPNNYNQINHINENKLDNRASNLEWCTQAYNNNYGTRNKRVRESLIKRYGIKIKATKDNQTYVFDSVGEASRKLNVYSCNIFNCLRGIIKQTGGYQFQRIESEAI